MAAQLDLPYYLGDQPTDNEQPERHPEQESEEAADEPPQWGHQC
jgi:hypothetical protein